MQEKRPIVTLLTDYGTKEHFVGAMKGVLLEINPQVDIIDISHEIASHDILEGAFTLSCYHNYFPHHTIHIAVVDPGVGTRRRPIIVSTENYTYIAPDNGLLSFVYETEPISRVIHITAEHFFHKPVSRTFHGRDIFAPVAAWISKGIELVQFGEEITDYVKLSTPKVRIVDAKLVQGVVLHIDKFGNVVTNFTERNIPHAETDELLFEKFIVANREITEKKEAYEEGSPKEVFVILGSSGYYEIVTSRGSAAALLGVRRGSEVTVALK